MIQLSSDGQFVILCWHFTW